MWIFLAYADVFLIKVILSIVFGTIYVLMQYAWPVIVAGIIAWLVVLINNSKSS